MRIDNGHGDEGTITQRGNVGDGRNRLGEGLSKSDGLGLSERRRAPVEDDGSLTEVGVFRFCEPLVGSLALSRVVCDAAGKSEGKAGFWHHGTVGEVVLELLVADGLPFAFTG